MIYSNRQTRWQFADQYLFLYEEGTNLIITRETDYALRILRTLSNGEQATAGEICKNEFLPLQFAYRILKKLERGGLVRIFRGSDGGCRLAADLKAVSLYDLLGIVEEKRLISSCMRPDFQCAWRMKNGPVCAVHKRLEKLQGQLDDELRGLTLQRMLFECEQAESGLPD